jgi:hypothetical protein
MTDRTRSASAFFSSSACSLRSRFFVAFALCARRAQSGAFSADRRETNRLADPRESDPLRLQRCMCVGDALATAVKRSPTITKGHDAPVRFPAVHDCRQRIFVARPNFPCGALMSCRKTGQNDSLGSIEIFNDSRHFFELRRERRQRPRVSPASQGGLNAVITRTVPQESGGVLASRAVGAQPRRCAAIPRSSASVDLAS